MGKNKLLFDEDTQQAEEDDGPVSIPPPSDVSLLTSPCLANSSPRLTRKVLLVGGSDSEDEAPRQEQEQERPRAAAPDASSPGTSGRQLQQPRSSPLKRAAAAAAPSGPSGQASAPPPRAQQQQQQRQTWSDPDWFLPSDEAKVAAVKQVLHTGSVEIGQLPTCRAAEESELLGLLRDCVLGGHGGSAYVSGVPGTGKTLTVHEVCREAVRWARAEKQPPVTVVSLNCMRLQEPKTIYLRVGVREPAGGSGRVGLVRAAHSHLHLLAAAAGRRLRTRRGRRPDPLCERILGYYRPLRRGLPCPPDPAGRGVRASGGASPVHRARQQRPGGVPARRPGRSGSAGERQADLHGVVM